MTPGQIFDSYPHGEVCRYNGKPYPLVEQLPYYGYVPKDLATNIKFRLELRARAGELTPDGKRFSPKARGIQKQLMEACRDDFLFFLAVFVYIVEPRKGQSLTQGIIPFIPWVNQEPVLAAIAHYAGRRHMVGDKSRDQGASWGVVALLVWLFIFHRDSHIGFGSKDQDSADKPSDPKSLGWKIDFVIKMLPVWMRPTGFRPKRDKWKDRTANSWVNSDNGSYIQAFAATVGIGRSGRFTLFFLDEGAFFPRGDREAVTNLLATTDCVLMISTPNGMDNDHYDRVIDPGPWLRLILDWRDNPFQSRGKYTTENGQLKIIDKEYPFPEHYKFILDGRTRSAWFDKKWRENKGNALLMDQEYNREYSGSKGRPFPEQVLERMRPFITTPLHTGTLEYDFFYPEDHDEFQWHAGEGYKFDLWVPIVGGFPPEGNYYFGIDLSRGVGGEGSSNSCISIWNDLREQVGELADNTIDPVEFAHLAVAVAYWFGHGSPTPLINWEIEGPGHEFGLEIVKKLSYPRLRQRPTSNEDSKFGRKPSGMYGYSNKDRDKAIRPLKTAVVNKSITIRSQALLDECGQYVIGDDGKPMHPRSKTARDGSAKGISHGDRVIAASMAILALDESVRAPKRAKKRSEVLSPSVIPADSIAGRQRSREAREREKQAALGRW